MMQMRRYRSMRIFTFFAALLFTASLFAVEDDAPKKRGGFTGSTPKPAIKKKLPPREEDGAKPERTTATPAPKKKARPVTESANEEKKSSPTDALTKPPKTSDVPDNPPPPEKREHAPSATVAPEEIAEFAAQPPKVQALITAALELTKLNLTYTYGSADPAQGGMDCSGTMYHVLREQGFKDVPRDSSGQYVWARKAGPFFAVVSKSAESFEFSQLLPGDLLFWTGTYETGREIPISHVMLYLGTEKKTKKRIMFGSSDGRSYAGVQRWGVSVFDFKMPKAGPANPEKSKVDFVGYGRIPALRESEAVERGTAVEKEALGAVVDRGSATPKPVVPKKQASSSSRRKGS